MNEGEERSLQRKATTAERRRERLPFPVQPARRLLIANNLIARVADRQRCQKRKRLVIPPAAIPLPRGSADGYPKSRARFPRPSRGGEHTTTESKAGNCCPQRDSCQPSTAPRKKELFCLPRPAAQGRYVPSPTKQGASALALPGLPAPSRVVPGQPAGGRQSAATNWSPSATGCSDLCADASEGAAAAADAPASPPGAAETTTHRSPPGRRSALVKLLKPQQAAIDETTLDVRPQAAVAEAVSAHTPCNANPH